MNTIDNNVDCAAWCYAYYIKDTNTGCLWSRNRWGSSTSLPDLYATFHAASKQLTTGKVSISVTYGGVAPKIYKILLAFEAR